ncbi:hypothetical protein ACQ4PT_004228 [Festuca glaucescens]
MRLITFRECCRLKKAALLPRPAPRKSRKKRVPPSVVRHSNRVAGHFASGTPIKRHQKALMVQLSIARERECISDKTLQAYLEYFNKKPMSEEDLVACLGLFGWHLAAMPLAGEMDREANHRLQKNFIVHLKVDGVLLADQDVKVEAVDEFYDQLLGSTPEQGYSLDLTQLEMQTHDLGELKAPFTKEEVCAVALHGMRTAEYSLHTCVGQRSGQKPYVQKVWTKTGDSLSPLLFDTVMDVLHLLFEKAVAKGLLAPLAPRGLRHRTSMYVDDVMTFVKPERLDVHTHASIVTDFGEASGLRTNLAKCSVHPIRCSSEQIKLSRSILRCEVVAWTCKYLGLPLVLHKPSTAQLQPVVDIVASRLQPWCAKPMTRGARAILVQITLCAKPVHAMMSLDITPNTTQALRKICRGFMWKARLDVQGGHCLVAWDTMASPNDLGGLGLPNLHLMNLALRFRWAWLQRVDPSKAWVEFDVRVPHLSIALFEVAIAVVLQNGEHALFWKDRWLNGQRVCDYAPMLVARVAARCVNTRTVKEGLADVG